MAQATGRLPDTPSIGLQYDEMRSRSPAVRRRLHVMEREMLLRTRGCQLVLDLGCGTGRFTRQLEVGQVIGIDSSKSMLRVAQRRSVCSVLADAHALPFGAAVFDAIVSTDQVFNFLEQEIALRECHRVLKPQGLLALHLATDAVWSLRSPLRLTERPMARGKSGDDLIEAACSLGFELDRVRLWRWLRWYPYLYAVPPVARVRLWNQGIMFFRKVRG